MADFRDFFRQFIEEKALSRNSVFTEAELITWFKNAHPSRQEAHIHHQLLKKTTNYHDRVRYNPPVGASDDLFFAVDPEFRIFRVYRQETDPLPYYLGKVSTGSRPKTPLLEEQQSVSDRATIRPNALFRADCLKLLESISSRDVTLVYLDPPSLSDDKNSAGQFENENDFLKFISLVVRHSRRILKDSGSLFFHSEPRTTPRIRPILEGVFGNQNFLNEFIWPRKAVSHSLSSRARSEYDTIFHYGKTDSVIYHPQYRLDDSSQKLARALVGKDERGHFLNEDLTSSVLRPSKQFSWRGFSPPTGRSWRFSEEQLDQLVSDDRIIFPPDGRTPVYKRYVDEPQEAGSVWDDIGPFAETRGDVNYPTQKPVELLDRIIRMSTVEQDLVVDPFCGTGTSLVAAQQNHRGWIGCDSLDEACTITKSRLEKMFQLGPGIDFVFEDQTYLDDFIPHMVFAGKPIANIRPEQEDTLTLTPDPYESGELSAALRYAIENKFPYPIAKPFYQLRGIYDLSAEVNQLANILGVTLEHLAILALAEYLSGDGRDERLSSRLSEAFKKPVSHGMWAGLLRDLLTFSKDRGENGFVRELHDSYFPDSNKGPSLSLKAISDDLVETRNDLIKRSSDALPPPDKLRIFKGRMIRFLQAVSFLKDYQLLSVANTETSGDIKTHLCFVLMGFHDSFAQAKLQCDLDIQKNRVALTDLRTHQLLYLYPFYCVNKCQEEGCGSLHWFRINKADGRRIDYLAGNGHKFRDETAGMDLANLLRRPWGTRLSLKARYMNLECEGTQPQLSEGQIIDGRYEIVRHLRRGGMADIYEVLEVGGNQLRALKLLPFQFISDRSVVQRFRQEALQASEFEHPKITRVLGHGESLVDHYLVMELATGWKLADGQVALDAGELAKPLPIGACISIIRQACEALDYIHASKVLHRDIKPANLLLFEGGIVKVSDFGIARSAEAMTLTLTGLPMGTPEYSSPEQVEAKRDLNFASDVYSLGVVMFELLTGSSPFKRATALASAFAQLYDPVPDPRSINPNLPSEVSGIVMRCLQKGPMKRYPTARALLKALMDYERSSEDEEKVSTCFINERTEYDSGDAQSVRKIDSSPSRGDDFVYFNNCRNRNHARIYGSGAFYDLNTTGFQSTKARNLHLGQKCIVATTGKDDKILFNWFSFLREEVKPDDGGLPCRVFVGEFLRSEEYSKAEAARKEPYSAFFDINGNFKRYSVIEGGTKSKTDLDHLLNSIGKGIFIQYYRHFADSKLSNRDVVHLLPEEYTLKSRQSRTAHARRIFREGLEREALELISHSDNVGFEIALEAEELLSEILVRLGTASELGQAGSGQYPRSQNALGIGARQRSTTTEGRFFEELQKRAPAEAEVAKRIFEWSLKNFSRVSWKGASFVPVLEYGADFSHNPITVFVLGKVPRVGIKFGRMKNRNGFPKEKRMELFRRLNNIPGVHLPADGIDKYPNILLSTLGSGNALEQFLQAIAWTNEEVKAMQKLRAN